MIEGTSALFEYKDKIWCDPLLEPPKDNCDLYSALCKVSRGRKRIYCLSDVRERALSKINFTVGESVQLAMLLRSYGGTAYDAISEVIVMTLKTRSQRGVAMGLPIGSLLLVGASNDSVSWLMSEGCVYIHDVIDRESLSGRHEYDRLDICKSEIAECLSNILTEEEKSNILK